MKIETNNLLNETLQFLASKPFHYDQQDDCFQLTESVEQATLQKHGNSYVFTTHGKQIQLLSQPVKKMWEHYSAKATKGVSEEMTKKIAARKRAIIEVRTRYGLVKEIESKVVACGNLIHGNNEIYVYLFPRGIVVLHIDFNGQRVKSYCYDTKLDELHNYAIKKNITLNKRAEKRGGLQANAFGKQQEV
ncbi:hypothetical protein [Aeromonas jandaei]|uniref:hypothetical protein n=1 Tax=Aeromonas jandaei TaxID=650 RepID=UPI001ADD7A60|nr:hypothetical protein [Aeromonas jandaei]QTL93359.1 hypothetical protein AjGTCBM29_01204 [Aeromonas jandaei]